MSGEPLTLIITLAAGRYGDGAEGCLTITDQATGDVVAMDVTAWRKSSAGVVHAKVVVQQQGGDAPEWTALAERLTGIVRAG